MASTGTIGRDARPGLLVKAAWTLLGVCALGLVLNFFTLVNTAEDSCGAGTESHGPWGTVGWSWLPPGQTCTYDIATPDWAGSASETTQLVTGGTWYLVSTIALMIVCGGLLIGLRRLRPAAAPAGWYADPDNQAGFRYWDGRAWTANRR